MKLPFYKYQGTGNDFILLDRISNPNLPDLTVKQIHRLCHRKFGIGADGLMYLDESEKYDFTMQYFNSDGNPSSMCGNGGRCIVHLAGQIGLIEKDVEFEFQGAIYWAQLLDNDIVKLKMQDVGFVKRVGDEFVLDTGSPHYVTIKEEDIQDIDVPRLGASIRYSDEFNKEGINVNFINERKKGIQVRTYERGVEDETLSCGTGVVASAIAYSLFKHQGKSERIIPVHTLGGQLDVELTFEDGIFKNIYLIGPATKVFTGTINL